MSRCGNCRLYWSEGHNNYGITCDGNCDIEECVTNLQDLVSALSTELKNKTEFMNSIVIMKPNARYEV